MEYIYYSGETDEKIYDIEWNRIERTKEEYPYSYSPITIWKNNKIKSDTTVYSDRLYRMDYEKYNRLCKVIWGNESQYFYDRKPEDIEKFLCLYFNKDIKLQRIKEECNSSNGFPYWRFDFKQFEKFSLES